MVPPKLNMALLNSIWSNLKSPSQAGLKAVSMAILTPRKLTLSIDYLDALEACWWASLVGGPCPLLLLVLPTGSWVYWAALPRCMPLFFKKNQNILFITHAIYWVSVSLPILWSRCALLLRAVPQGTHTFRAMITSWSTHLISQNVSVFYWWHCLMTRCVGSATPTEPPWMFSVGWSGSSLTTSNPQVLKALSLSAYLTGTPGLCLPSSPLFSTSLRCFMFPFSPFSSYLGLIKSFITSPSSTPSRKHC